MHKYFTKIHEPIHAEYNRRFTVKRGYFHYKAFCQMYLSQIMLNSINEKGEGMTRLRAGVIKNRIKWLFLFSFYETIPLYFFAMGGATILNFVSETKVLGLTWGIMFLCSYYIWFQAQLRKQVKQDYKDLVNEAKIPKNRWGK